MKINKKSIFILFIESCIKIRGFYAEVGIFSFFNKAQLNLRNTFFKSCKAQSPFEIPVKRSATSAM